MPLPPYSIAHPLRNPFFILVGPSLEIFLPVVHPQFKLIVLVIVVVLNNSSSSGSSIVVVAATVVLVVVLAV